MAVKVWVLDEAITPTELNRIETALAQSKLGGTTAGTATALTATVDGFTSADLSSIFLKTHVDIDAAATLNVNGSGARPLYMADNTAVKTGIIKAGTIIQVAYNTTNSRFFILGDGSGGSYTPVNKAGDVMTGNLGIGAATQQNTAGRGYVTVKGATGAGAVELQTATADAAGVVVGDMHWIDINSIAADKRVAMIEAQLAGATANNRGGSLILSTKENGTSGLKARLTIYDTGVISTQYNTIDDGYGNMILKNGSGVYGYTTGGATRKLAQVNGSDQVEIGVTASETLLTGSKVKTANNVLDDGTGQIISKRSNDNFVANTVAANQYAGYLLQDAGVNKWSIVKDINANDLLFYNFGLAKAVMSISMATGVLNTISGLQIETRTTDPAGAAVGRIWFRTDL